MYQWMLLEEILKDGIVFLMFLIKRQISDRLDHRNLNEIFDFNPTAENIAKWICDQLPQCYRVDVQESEGNMATYEESEE